MMSDSYVRGIIRKSIGMICRKCKVDRISKIGLDVMVDATLLCFQQDCSYNSVDIASLRSEIQTRQEERNHVRPLLQDVTDAVFPPVEVKCGLNL